MLSHLLLDVLGQLHRTAPRSTLDAVIPTGLGLGSACAVASGCLGRSRVAVVYGALAGAALAVAISLTLFRAGGRPGSIDGLRTCVVTDPSLLSADGLANLALFAPAAFLAVLAVGRPSRVAAVLAGLSLAVEGLQAMRSIGVCDSSDALLNFVGALVAAFLAAGMRSALAWKRPLADDVVPGSDACRRSC